MYFVAPGVGIDSLGGFLRSKCAYTRTCDFRDGGPVFFFLFFFFIPRMDRGVRREDDGNTLCCVKKKKTMEKEGGQVSRVKEGRGLRYPEWHRFSGNGTRERG